MFTTLQKYFYKSMMGGRHVWFKQGLASIIIIFYFIHPLFSNPIQYAFQIDSLTKRIDHDQIEDTSFIKTLYTLGQYHFYELEYGKGFLQIHRARLLSSKLGFQKGVGIYLRSMAIFHKMTSRSADEVSPVMETTFENQSIQFFKKLNIQEDTLIKNPIIRVPEVRMLKYQLDATLKSLPLDSYKEEIANIHFSLMRSCLCDSISLADIIHGDRAESYFKELNKKEELGRTIIEKMKAFHHLKRYNESITEELKAIDLINNTSDLREKAYLYEVLGLSYDDMRRVSGLIQCYMKSNEIWTSIGDKKEQVHSLFILGRYSQFTGELKKSYNYLKQSIDLRKETDYMDGIDETYSTLAFRAVGLGYLAEAEKYIVFAQKYLKENPAPFRQASLYDAEGQLLQAQKKYTEAINKYRKSAEFFSITGLQVFISYQYYHIGQCCQSLGNIKEGIKNAFIAYEIATKQDWADIEINSSLLLSELYKEKGNMAEAYKYSELSRNAKAIWDAKEDKSKIADYEIQTLINKKKDEQKAQVDLLNKDILVQKNQRNVLLFGFCILALIGGTYFYHQHKMSKLEQSNLILAEKVNMQEALLQERSRMSRELHDEIGSTLSGISMYSRLANTQMETESKSNVSKSLQIIQSGANEMVSKLSDIVWLSNPEQDSFEKLIQRLEDYAFQIAAVKNITVKVNVSQNISANDLPMENRRNLYLICKEAINNAVKYSNCTFLELEMNEIQENLIIIVRDNGNGFVMNAIKPGNGLANMKKRAAEIGADFKITSAFNQGCEIRVRLKSS